MKKRLSLLMAALMIVTMLPMSAFAAATAVYTTLDITASEDDKESEYKNVSVTFNVPKGSAISKDGKLRLELDNGAQFRPKTPAGNQLVTDGNITASLGTVTLADAGASVPGGAQNIMFLSFGGADVASLAQDGKLVLNIPVYFPNEGDVMLRLTDENNAGLGTLQPIKIAVVREQSSALDIKVKDAEKMVSFDGGELSQFEIKNFPSVKSAANNRTITLSLDDDHVKFDETKTQVFVDGAKVNNLNYKDGVMTIAQANLVDNDKVAKNILVIPFVQPMGRKASEGSIKVDVRIVEPDGNSTKTIASNSATIGKVVDYKVTMTIVEKGKKEMPSLWGGEKVTVTVTLKGPKGSIGERPIDFTADGADVEVIPAGKKATIKPAPNPAKDVTFKGTEAKDADKKLLGIYEDAEFETTEIPKGTEEVKFDITIRTAHNKDGVATLTAAQRGWEVKADMAKITPKLAIKAEEMPVKKGEARETANIVITEAKAGLLTRQDKVQVRFDTRRDYTQFATKAFKIEATNGMKFGEPSYAKGSNYTVVEFPVTKQSSGEAAVITISGVKVLVDGSSTDDVIPVWAQLNGNKVVKADYIKVVKEYALESILTVFTIGQTQYTVNGQAKTAASAPYVKNGRTMLPVRALAESLGLHVQWNGQTKTATFTDSTKVAAVVIGAETMHINGTPVKLAAKAELVNGTTFIELRSLATAFGVQIDWDAAAKTATVSK